MTRTRGSASPPVRFTERFAKVNGIRLRYLIGGQGSAVVLLHGYAETGHMWRPIMPLLAKRHTVVVPDLRGAGASAKPLVGYDKKNIAMDIHELTEALKPWRHLRDLLLEIGRIEPIRRYDEEYLSIRTPDVLARIEAGDESWEAMVPAVVAVTIRTKRLFGYHTITAANGSPAR